MTCSDLRTAARVSTVYIILRVRRYSRRAFAEVIRTPKARQGPATRTCASSAAPPTLRGRTQDFAAPFAESSPRSPPPPRHGQDALLSFTHAYDVVLLVMRRPAVHQAPTARLRARVPRHQYRTERAMLSHRRMSNSPPIMQRLRTAAFVVITASLASPGPSSKAVRSCGHAQEARRVAASSRAP